MKKDYRIYIDDILEAIEKITEYVADGDEVRFSRDSQQQDAVIRRFTIIGEAATRLPQEIRLLAPTIPWKSVIGLRNIVIHEYANVSLGKAWEVTQEDLPKLKKALMSLRLLLDEEKEAAS
ncbi:MAG: DUF86 domain-containing protein [Patescibacteria group bacterium]